MERRLTMPIKVWFNELHHKMVTRKKAHQGVIFEEFVWFFCVTFVVVVIATPNAKIIVEVVVTKFLGNLLII